MPTDAQLNTALFQLRRYGVFEPQQSKRLLIENNLDVDIVGALLLSQHQY